MMKLQLARQIITILFVSCFVATDAVSQTIHTDSLQNQTISNDVFVQGSSQLVLKNITVTSSGQLKATATGGVVLNGPFEVQHGGRLELKGGRQNFIRYTYDASGNRKSRRKITE